MFAIGSGIERKKGTCLQQYQTVDVFIEGTVTIGDTLFCEFVYENRHPYQSLLKFLSKKREKNLIS